MALYACGVSAFQSTRSRGGATALYGAAQLASFGFDQRDHARRIDELP